MGLFQPPQSYSPPPPPPAVPVGMFNDEDRVIGEHLRRLYTKGNEIGSTTTKSEEPTTGSSGGDEVLREAPSGPVEMPKVMSRPENRDSNQRYRDLYKKGKET